MSDYDYGPIQTYEITWLSGHTEKIQAHQVSWPGNLLFGDPTRRQQIRFHAAKPWRLVLQAYEDEIRSIRNVTADEPVPVDPAGGAS